MMEKPCSTPRGFALRAHPHLHVSFELLHLAAFRPLRAPGPLGCPQLETSTLRPASSRVLPPFSLHLFGSEATRPRCCPVLEQTGAGGASALLAGAPQPLLCITYFLLRLL